MGGWRFKGGSMRGCLVDRFTVVSCSAPEGHGGKTWEIGRPWGLVGDKGQLVGRLSWGFQSETKFRGGNARTNERPGRPGRRTNQPGTRETIQAHKPKARAVGSYHQTPTKTQSRRGPAGGSEQAPPMRARCQRTTRATPRALKNNRQHLGQHRHPARQVDRISGLQRKTKFSGVKLKYGRPNQTNHFGDKTPCP